VPRRHHHEQAARRGDRLDDRAVEQVEMRRELEAGAYREREAGRGKDRYVDSGAELGACGNRVEGDCEIKRWR
jgi:hypothetical protein